MLITYLFMEERFLLIFLVISTCCHGITEDYFPTHLSFPKSVETITSFLFKKESTNSTSSHTYMAPVEF